MAIGDQIIRLEEVTSTNTLVLERPAYMEHHGLVLVAQHQTGGRGRMGRHWASMPGRQLQFSVVLHPEFPAEDYPAVALVAGLAVAQALEAVLGLHPSLKWPNDVLIGSRKVCGILVEGGAGPGGRPRLVAGIGVNCHGRSEDFPEPLQQRLTTLAQEAGRSVDADALLDAILQQLDALWARLSAGEKPALLEQWLRYGLMGEGQRVLVQQRDGEREGIPETLTPEGYLVVRFDDGTRWTQVSGELEWLF